MAEFIYGDARLVWEPERGYRDILTGEWVASPVDAVERYVEEAPEEREAWRTLAQRVQTFWIGHVVTPEDVEGLEEVVFH